MRTLTILAVMACCVRAEAQRPDLAACPCGPDWIVGADRALIPQDWYGANFRPACNRHDACLNAGCDSRGRCDRQFRRDLLASCRNSARPGECRRVSNIMYRAVRSYGGRDLSPYEQQAAINRLREANARYGRNPYPGYAGYGW
ncbi:MAG: phospholipase A2 [Planctomycetaceae bacterium]